MTALSDDEKAMLALEAQTWIYPGAKEAAIRERFDVSPTRYRQMLLALIRTERAMAHDPITVKRLLRQAGRGR